MTIGRLLFCATDAGGARNIAPVAAQVGEMAVVVGSEATAPLFVEYGVDAEIVAVPDCAAAAALIGRIQPQAIVCGTTRYMGAERFLTMAARGRTVPSVAVLDEWYGYRARFFDANGTGDFLADLVCCPDALARREAAEEGLPDARLLVTGSPSLSTLVDRIERFAGEPPPLPSCWSGRDTGARILFLSENHVIDYGTAPDRPGGLGSWIGYTELDVRAILARLLVASRIQCTVVEKLHPGAIHLPCPPEPAPKWEIAFQEPLWPLLWHADLIIGMRTMALLEASLMGHRPLSFQPNLRGDDQCKAVHLGLANPARTEDEVLNWLRSSPARGAVCRPDFADSRATMNVLDAALRLATAVSP